MAQRRRKKRGRLSKNLKTKRTSARGSDLGEANFLTKCGKNLAKPWAVFVALTSVAATFLGWQWHSDNIDRETTALLEQALDILGGKEGTVEISQPVQDPAKLELARRLLEKAETNRPRWAKPHVLKAVYHHAQKETELAERELNIAYQLAPTDQSVLYGLCNLYFEQRKFNKAARTALRGLRMRRWHSLYQCLGETLQGAYYQNLGSPLSPLENDIFRHLGLPTALPLETPDQGKRRAMVIKSFERSLHYAPSDQRPLARVAGFLVQLEEKGLAIDVLRAAFEGGGDPDEAGMSIALARLLTEEGKDEDARAVLEEATRRFPRNHIIAHNYAYSLDISSQFGMAKLMYKRAIEINPNSSRSWIGLGYVDFRLGNFEDAVTSLEKALRIAPGDGEVMYYLAFALWGAGKQTESKALLNDCKNFEQEYELKSRCTLWSTWIDIMGLHKDSKGYWYFPQSSVESLDAALERLANLSESRQ